MKTKGATHRYRKMGQFLIAFFVACTVLVTTAIPVTYASNSNNSFSSALTSRAYYPEDSVPCNGNGISYKDGVWPAHFHVGGCLVKEIKEYGWTLDIVNLISQEISKSPKLAIATGILIIYIDSEIGPMYEQSQVCNGNGVNINFYLVYGDISPEC